MAMQIDGFHEVSPILRSGIYALVQKGSIVYIGKAKCILNRAYTHRSNWVRTRKGQAIPEWLQTQKGILFDELHVYPCPDHLLDAEERRLIDIYRPVLNKLLKSNEYMTREVSVSIKGLAFTLNEVRAPGPQISRRV